MSSPSPAATDSGDHAALRMARMQVEDLDEVVRIESAIYPFPWTRGNFMDSLASGYETWIARDAAGNMVGYFLLMMAVDDGHLLNITVAEDFQRRGIGRRLLDKVVLLAREAGMRYVLLEVRPSNRHALEVYRHVGFSPIGIRRNYYPAPANTREDAIVMRLPV